MVRQALTKFPYKFHIPAPVQARQQAVTQAVAAFISAVQQAGRSVHIEEKCPKLIPVINIHFNRIPN